MNASRPWDTDDADANWAGYFLPGTEVLRNRVGATTRAEFADAENDLVEVRVAELRDDLTLVARTYDLASPEPSYRGCGATVRRATAHHGVGLVDGPDASGGDSVTYLRVTLTIHVSYSP